jgi:ABC-type branched-subunit amino acid transport system substrate-binding protein
MTITAVAIAVKEPARSATTKIGNGSVKVGLVLPLSANDPAGAVGRSFRNAAEMALVEAADPAIELLVEDDGGSAEGAERAVRQAVDEGAEIVLGPLFADSVRGATPIARTSGVPMVVFSNDLTVATPGIYLLGALPKFEVDRIVGFAIESGKHALAALLPDSVYGRVVEAEFRAAVDYEGGTIAAIEHYPEAGEPAHDIGQQIARSPAEAILLADRTDAIGTAAQYLKTAGVDLQRVQLVGTAPWYDARIFANQALQGAWFAGPDMRAYAGFASRYHQRFNEIPAPYALMAYDSVALVRALDKKYGVRRFSTAALTDPSGFMGVTGLFRFKPDGSNERTLSVYRVTPSGGEIVSAAAEHF